MTYHFLCERFDYGRSPKIEGRSSPYLLVDLIEIKKGYCFQFPLVVYKNTIYAHQFYSIFYTYYSSKMNQSTMCIKQIQEKHILYMGTLHTSKYFILVSISTWYSKKLTCDTCFTDICVFNLLYSYLYFCSQVFTLSAIVIFPLVYLCYISFHSEKVVWKFPHPWSLLIHA